MRGENESAKVSGWEPILVFALSLGQSAVYAVVALAAALSAGPLRGQSTTLNPSVSARPYVDLTYQLLGIGFALIPAALACYFLALSASPTAATPVRLSAGARLLGFDWLAPGRDLAHGLGLAALIGIPGLVFFALGRLWGITVQVQAAALNLWWWTVPVLILQACKNAILEELLVTGYLLVRLEERGWNWWAASVFSAGLRGSYHLYQGFGPFFGNVVMGLIFNEYYRRRGRTAALVVAHTVLDIVAFVGWQFMPPAVLAYFGLT